MAFDDLVTAWEPPPNRVGKSDGFHEHHLYEGAVMVAYAMHLLRTQGAREVRIHPEGEHGKQFDFAGWLGRRNFTKVSSFGGTAYGGIYRNPAGRAVLSIPSRGLATSWRSSGSTSSLPGARGHHQHAACGCQQHPAGGWDALSAAVMTGAGRTYRTSPCERLGPAAIGPLPGVRAKDAVRDDAVEKSTTWIRETSGPRWPAPSRRRPSPRREGYRGRPRSMPLPGSKCRANRRQERGNRTPSPDRTT